MGEHEFILAAPPLWSTGAQATLSEATREVSEAPPTLPFSLVVATGEIDQVLPQDRPFDSPPSRQSSSSGFEFSLAASSTAVHASTTSSVLLATVKGRES
ncbi:hypothetical protein EJB05_18233 [Eragrostis curvula]|uniref:Uncharacterized protein n=1 Tax=Eragrostis curvula TaxID=38414 RepID=A0A5J9VJE1_9POAL|nr:hypothetical protein EJB05_18233 [Eragrostis curvula]